MDIANVCDCGTHSTCKIGDEKCSGCNKMCPEMCDCGEHTTCKEGDATCTGCHKVCPVK